MSRALSTTADAAKTAIRRVVDWTLFRKPVHPEDLVLSAEALVWLSRMPVPVRPLMLSRRFPRIVNQMASSWNNPSKTLTYFDSLLVDRRGDRQGFPYEVLQELVNLKAYYTEVLAPSQKAAAWDDSHMF
jgi:hypothetical protein